MFHPAFQDFIKPQWRKIIETLKHDGGLPVAELARRTAGSYMTVKTHCEELAEAGYLARTRLPRAAVGRPEIFYSLAGKADALFPLAGIAFAIEMLEELRAMHGESAPERLLNRHFGKTGERHAAVVGRDGDLVARVIKLANLRHSEGHACRCDQDAGQPLRMVECHNPLQPVFERFPRAVMMELRMIEHVLGAGVRRSELPGTPHGSPRVVFEIPAGNTH
jgi:predicted ArsR family transcriptional regulator